MALSYSTGLVHQLFSPTGKGFGEALSDFVIDIYTGTKPTNADAPVVLSASVVKLGTVIRGGAVVGGDPTTYGLRFGEPVNRSVDKLSSQTWQFTGTVAGTAGFFRLRMHDDANDQSVLALRIDGTIGRLSGADLILSDNVIALDNVYTLNKFKLTWPV